MVGRAERAGPQRDAFAERPAEALRDDRADGRVPAPDADDAAAVAHATAVADAAAAIDAAAQRPVAEVICDATRVNDAKDTGDTGRG